MVRSPVSAMGGGDPRRYRGPKPPPLFQDDESYSAPNRADRTELHNARTTWSAARHSAAVPLPAMNEALVHWLMGPDAPDERLTLEGFLRRPGWHQRAA